jgi:hypothetical protein
MSCDRDFSPSREDQLLSDKVFSLAGHSFTIHYFGLYLAAAILLLAFVLFLWGYFRGKRTARARTVPRDELSMYLGRMADSMEVLQRVVSQISSNLAGEPPRREVVRQEAPAPVFTRQQVEAQKESAPPAAKSVPATHSIPYSIFGR